jgi:hypothetical protein
VITRPAQDALRRRLPELPLAGRIGWDPARAMKAADTGRPQPMRDLLRQLQITERAQPVLAQVQPGWTASAQR